MADKKTAPAKNTTQEKKPFTPWTTEQKREYGKKFSEAERASYRKGQANAYSHSANMAGRQAKFIRDNGSSK